MIPVGDKVRQRLIQAIESELEQLRIEEKIPQADKGLMTDDEYASAINEYEVIRQDLLDSRLIVFDTRPQCTHVDNSKSGNIKGMAVRCEAEGRYSPIIFVFAPNEDAPLAQLEVQPPQRCCTEHATGRLNQYFSKPQWREIQAQVQKQSQILIHFDDARVMFMDHKTQTIVTPPTPAIVIVN